ncbi:hypothetical protein KSX_17200 [Ktedonospora formicarum]|uniref:Urocanate hydratase n=1 Tax=Ktedonospora formicarum TaxID=2778364 RepID=A0A8J3MP80_9CHLR|nr:hypothetical protein KSX_17200 [Ktedonospora formicarum]
MPEAYMPGIAGPRPVRAPRGNTLSCKGWQQEAALRMLMNNLDPEVAERPDDLVVYGGSGRAARSWAAFDAIVRSLRELDDDETLLVQSGKPVGIFRTHKDAPRVLIANSNLVPHWGNWDEFRRLEAQGLTMYGQMTAGSWIYIGSQGIVQGTYETFAEAARQHFGGTLKGRFILTAGLGGMGGAQPLAVTMNEGVCLAVEPDTSRIQRRLDTGYCDEIATTLDEALNQIREACSQGQALSIGLVGNAAEIYPELVRRGIIPDMVTDQTSAHDALNGYIPAGLSIEAANDLRARDPQEYIKRSMASMVEHVQAMLAMQKQGAVVFDYGNNLRGQALAAGEQHALDFPGFVPAYIRPSSVKDEGHSAGWRSLVTPRISTAQMKRCSSSSPRIRLSNAGLPWLNRRSTSRGSRRVSAGLAMANGTKRAWPSMS